MIEAARMRKEKEMHSEDIQAASCWGRLELDVMDAQNLEKVTNNNVSHLMGSLVYFMLPDYKKGLSEAHRVLSDDGVFACTSWAKIGWLVFVTQAAQKVTQRNTTSVVRTKKCS
jgi:ubiquinone/menaquinone biosynthesis C-methylase UbiE